MPLSIQQMKTETESEPYQSIPESLLVYISDELLKFNFKYHHPVLRGALFTDNTTQTAVIIDYLICERRYSYSVA